jgi:hypothetical protein
MGDFCSISLKGSYSENILLKQKSSPNKILAYSFILAKKERNLAVRKKSRFLLNSSLTSSSRNSLVLLVLLLLSSSSRVSSCLVRPSLILKKKQIFTFLKLPANSYMQRHMNYTVLLCPFILSLNNVFCVFCR